MPPGLFKRSASTGGLNGSGRGGVVFGGDAASGPVTPHFLNRIRAPAAALMASNPNEEAGAPTGVQTRAKSAEQRKRIIFYPNLVEKKKRGKGGDAEADGNNSTAATDRIPSRRDEIVAARMARRPEMNYHVPPPQPKKANQKPKKPDEYDEYIPDPVKPEDEDDGPPVKKIGGLFGCSVAVPVPKAFKKDGTDGGGDGADGSAGGGAKAAGEADGEEDRAVIVDRYPVSPHGKLYFQVETDGATRHEVVGIIIIDTEELGIMMYDRVGRQFGNRPDPGYPIKQEEVDSAKAGSTLKVGAKNVLLITALTEEAFRSGEFFLRSEHDMRVKEDKRKAKEAAAEALVVKEARSTMTFGKTFLGVGGGGVSMLFAAQNLRKRPREGQTGFTVPLAGRAKVGKNGLLEDLVALHDVDRPGAVVLFRADYKRDIHGRRQVSVVVDPIVGDKLRPHQRIGVQFLFDCITGVRMPGYHGAILADEMGLGKTIQTVAAIYTCLKQGKHGQVTARKCMVVAPSSLVQNWCNEFDKWLGEGAVKHFAISESTPKGDRIISRFEGDGDVLVISYDQLRKYVVRLAGLKMIDLVVCDEGHRLKNAEVKTTKAVDLIPTRNRIILSGTPIQNDLSEFHAMVNFVNPGILGNRDLFNRVFEEPVSIGRDPDSEDCLKSLGRDRAHYLSILTQRFILRRKQSINESYLPPKVDVTVYVRLGEVQEAAYRKLAELVEGSACTPLVLISALRKLCNHMDLFHEAVQLSQQSRARAVAAAKEDKGRGAVATIGRGKRKEAPMGIPLAVIPKDFRRGNLGQAVGSKLHFVSLVLDELLSNGERDKLVIVSNFTQTLDIIAALCKVKRIGYFQLDGSTPIKKRQQLVDYFNVPGSQEVVFLLSSKAGGVGLNLIGANRLILFDPDWNPANDAQAMGRVWRDGQKKRVFIYRLLCTGTIEEKIYQRQVSKQGLSANVVDMQDDSKQHFTLEELKALFKYKADTLCDTHDLLDCDSCEAALAEGKGRKSGKDAIPKSMKFRRVGGDKLKKAGGGPRMDELKAWQHISNIASFALDKVTRIVATAAPKLLTFLFADERDNTKKAIEPTLMIEKPLADDDDGIIVASQAACQAEESDLDIEIHSESDSESESEFISVDDSSDDDEEE